MNIPAWLGRSLLVALLPWQIHCAMAEPAPDKATRAKEKSDSPWEKVTTYDTKVLAEISGLAPSGRDPGLLWAHNDSGGQAALHALNLKGDFLGSVEITGVTNVDWEDMAAFRHEGKPYLLIADAGDNQRKRSVIKLHAVPEPVSLGQGTGFVGMKVAPAWTVTVRYVDGPQDCESIAVLPGENQILLLNKVGKGSTVYAVPLRAKPGGGTQIAKRYAVLPEVMNATGDVISFLKAGVLGPRATAMDVSPEGHRAVVLTYTDIRIFKCAEDQSWAQALTKTPMVIALPSIYQPEALCFSADGKSIYVSSEETPTPLVRIRVED